MTKHQEELVKLFKEGKKKQLKRLLNHLFKKPEEGLDIVSAAVAACDPKTKGLVKEALSKARSRFAQLPWEDFLRVLKIYYFGNNSFQSRFPFEIAVILGGSKKGEYPRAKLIFEKILQILRAYRVPSSQEGTEFKAHLVGLTFLYCLIASSGITFTWENLIRAGQTDEKAREILKEILCLQVFYQFEGISLLPESQWNPGRDPSINLPSKAMKALGINKRTALIPVPDDLQEFVQKLWKEVQEDITKKNSSLVEILSFFCDNFYEFQISSQEMWREISTSPKYGLRKDGKDRVSIGVKALRESGHRMFQFFPEEGSFPSVKVKFWLEMEGYFSITLNLNGGNLSEYNLANLPEDDPRVWVERLLIFIALHSYWMIVTGKKGKPQIKTGKTEKSRQGREEKEHQRHGILSVVRPHFRHLFPGWQASEGALSLAEQVFQTKPSSGFTFVREHLRGYQEAEESTQPLFTYSEQMLNISGGVCPI